MCRIAHNTARMLTTLLAVFSLTAVTNGQARADVYTSEAAFLAAISNPTTETFESFAVGTLINNGSTFNGLTYNFAGGPYSNAATGLGTLLGGRTSTNFFSFGFESLAANRPAGSANVSPDGAYDFYPGDTVTVTAATPIRAIGVYFNYDGDPGTFANLGDFSVSIPSLGLTATSGNNPVASPVLNPTGRQTLYFVGITSATPFTTAVFGSRDYGSTAQGSPFTLDNITTAAVLLPAGGPVPAPATLLVFGGLMAVGFRVRRRGV